MKVDPEAEAEVEGMIQMPHLIKVPDKQVQPIKVAEEVVRVIPVLDLVVFQELVVQV